MSVASAAIVFLCCMWIIRCAVKSGKNRQTNVPPETVPMPEMNGRDRYHYTESTPRLGTGSYPPLPKRSGTPYGRAGARGPRGIYPSQFPICPIDRQKNLSGQPQKIFWHDGENCYYCSNGHRFRSNGSIIID